MYGGKGVITAFLKLGNPALEGVHVVVLEAVRFSEAVSTQ